MTTEYISELGLKALPIIVDLAQKREVMTYGELGKKLGVHHRTVIPHVLGYIRDEICSPRKLPLLNVLIVRQDDRLPGESFLPKGTRNLSDEEYERKFEQHRDKVFLYDKWDDLLKDLNLSPIKRELKDLDKIGKEYSAYIRRKGAAGEGEGHRKLKNYVADNPRALGLRTSVKGIKEYLFPSGDECDVIFDIAGDTYAVVEIKNGDEGDGELIKGVYQAVKYRALMKAEKGHGKPMKVQAFLVAYQITRDIEELATLFNISCVVINKSHI
jgi:hypothetical protein